MVMVLSKNKIKYGHGPILVVIRTMLGVVLGNHGKYLCMVVGGG
jgi:hypothetical protein